MSAPGVARGDVVDAFDADVLIFAASPDHPLGAPVRALLEPAGVAGAGEPVGVGSVLLVPEVLTKPFRDDAADELEALAALLGRIDLIPVDSAIANLATALGARYGLRAADAVHLATAVSVGADRFVTNNRKDFDRSITEIDIVHPDEL
jgi:predicted nucleic acid-binding protein